MTTRYRVLTVDGNETAEQVLNEAASANERLVASHVEAAHDASGSEHQDNVMLGAVVNRFTFIFASD